MRLAELCAGYGGLGLALHQAGIDHRLVWWADNDARAAAVMAAHHPDLPNLGDITTITDPPEVDIVAAGFPCQPVSVAGGRRGVDDARWIVDDVCRVARLAGARWLILENVAGILTANDGDALARVCEVLAREGFRRWEWCTLRASDVGAPHRRKRWFCVAYADGQGSQGQVQTGRRVVPVSRPDLGAAPDAHGSRLAGIRGGGVPSDGDPPPGGDADRRDRQRFGGYAPAIVRWEHILGRSAPDPTTDGRLNPEFVEWMMGLPAGHVTDHLPRRHALHVLGNGVVPQQAAAALAILAPALDEAVAA